MSALTRFTSLSISMGPAETKMREERAVATRARERILAVSIDVETKGRDERCAVSGCSMEVNRLWDAVVEELARK